MTSEEKIHLVHGKTGDNYLGNQAGFVEGVKRLGIPDIFICDGESGVNVSWDATMLPAKVGLAASFDAELSRRYGETLGREAQCAGMNVILTPRVNIVRDPVADIHGSNGGNYQTYGEDPFLNSRMGAAEAVGIQRDNKCIANLKQMFGSSTGTAQGSPACVIGTQALREIYMRVFEAPIRAGVASAMTNYNMVNGIWTSEFTEMNKTLCRDEWGFDGFLLDDWHCLFNPLSIMENVTLEMPGNDYVDGGSAKSVYGQMLIDEIKDPASPVTEDHLDKAVGYYLNTLDRFGMLDAQRLPGPLTEEIKESGIRDAKEIAIKTAVLLKNDREVLPLDIKNEKIALIGPTARQTAAPVFKEASYGFPDRRIGSLEALSKRAADSILFAVGNDLEGVVVPASGLITRSGRKNGLSRRIVDLPEWGSHESLPECFSEEEDTVTDRQVCFANETALPALEMKFDGMTVVPFYLWEGAIISDETGWHRLSLQTYTPGVSEFAKNIKRGWEMEIVTSGNLYFRHAERAPFECLGSGYRVLRNGGAAPNSSVVPTLDGWNNVGGYVYMEAGKPYDIRLTACSVYKIPVGVRLCWVTPSMEAENIREAAETAAKADKAVIFAWHKSPSLSLDLEECQNRLIAEIAKANPNTVVVINSGDPVAMPWLDQVKGVLEMWYPGQEGGYATVDILTGRVNPGGKLPVTFPKRLADTAPHAPGHPERCGVQKRLWSENVEEKYVSYFTEGVNMGYRWFDENNTEPLFEFGFGLSYTRFIYSDLRLETNKDGIIVEFFLKNSGSRVGEEVVQCYAHRPDVLPNHIKASPKILAAFARVSLEAGETKQVKLFVSNDSLSYFDTTENKWILPMRPRYISVGASSRELRLSGVAEVRR
ncbi:MAG: glycoside hydrolase family 3 C-terminal domain-containing protein [Clostridiales bacterium]|nr:glycoside hydrolase family 3 C-terminal domain-containing protein [Clostridiales bacterium]